MPTLHITFLDDDAQLVHRAARRESRAARERNV
jgi:hypothetical protein